MRRTRIVCTLGPASESDAVMRAMIQSGMDVARLNFSHGDHATQLAHIQRVRRLAREEGANVAILADLQGPKIRLGNVAGDTALLIKDAEFILTVQPIEGNASKSSVDFPSLPQVVKPGNQILIDDGLIELSVVSTSPTEIVTRVITGGDLKSHKGVNLPGIPLAASPLTEKDRADLAFALEQGVDYVAQSFVRRAQDIVELRKLMTASGQSVPIVAKIEKREALEHIDEIIDASDAVMVARGDLGVEAPPEYVPLYQKEIIRKATAAGKPVITATQMLESMSEHPRPTRAEASDVANAILDSTDAVMLSAETATGLYPVQSVETMARIADAAEENLQSTSFLNDAAPRETTVTNAIGLATCEIARQLAAQVILTATFSGFTARVISRHRPSTPIFAVTTSESTCRRLALVWGVQCAVVREATSSEAMITAGIDAAVRAGAVKRGDLVVVTGGVPVGVPGRTNMVQVRIVGEEQN